MWVLGADVDAARQNAIAEFQKLQAKKLEAELNSQKPPENLNTNLRKRVTGVPVESEKKDEKVDAASNNNNNPDQVVVPPAGNYSNAQTETTQKSHQNRPFKMQIVF